MKLGEMNNEIPKLDDGSIDYLRVAQKLYVMGIRRGTVFLRAMVDEVRAEERKRAAKVIDEYKTRATKSPNRGRDMDVLLVGCDHLARDIRNLGEDT